LTDYKIGDIIVYDSFTGNAVYVIIEIVKGSNKGTYYFLKETITGVTIKVHSIEMRSIGQLLVRHDESRRNVEDSIS